MAKKGRGMISEAGKAILTVEAASVGHQLINPMISGSSSNMEGWN
jgi:hypothetical protein